MTGIQADRGTRAARGTRAGLVLSIGIALGILAIAVYVLGARAAAPVGSSTTAPSAMLVAGFAAASLIWITGAACVAHALGVTRPDRAVASRVATFALGAVPIGFVGTVLLLYAPAVPVLAAAATGLVALALIPLGATFAVFSRLR